MLCTDHTDASRKKPEVEIMGKKILIVDDEKSIIEYLKNLLESTALIPTF